MSQYDASENEIIIEKKEREIEFWGENPNILLQTLHEMFPTPNMSYNQNLNAITRLIIILTTISFICSQNTRLIIILLFTLAFIYAIHHYQNKMKEEFGNITDDIIKENDIDTDDVFDSPTSSNPFSNVLVTDIEYNPEKKPAPPAFQSDINDSIVEQTKNMIEKMNPGQDNIKEKLFKDLGEELTLEQSLRQFHSNANTMVVNDQTGFAEFCYGDMVSCKEGNLFACARNRINHNLY
jgi:hypothetical protein